MKFKILTILLVVITSCKPKTSELPILSYNYVNGKKELYKIDDFEFINQDGEKITSSSTKGKVHTMNFFFTTCPSICPPMRIKQMDLAQEFSNEKNFKQYSISIDFKKDTLQKIKHYSNIHDINSKHWQLLRAPSEEHLDAIAEKLKTNFKPNDDGTDFYHSSYLALIDKDHYIRGFYDILLDSDIALLKEDIKSLLN